MTIRQEIAKPDPLGNLISCERVAAEDVKSQFHRSFRRSNLISCERVAPEVSKSQCYRIFLPIEPHLVRTLNRNFTADFADQTSFRAKGLGRTLRNRNFTAVFFRSNLVSWERVAPDTSKSPFYRRFFRSNLISCERVATKV